MTNQHEAASMAAPDAALLNAVDARLRARAEAEVAAVLDPALEQAANLITAALTPLIGRGIVPTVHHTIQADAGARIRAIAQRAAFDIALKAALAQLAPEPAPTI